MRGKFPLLLFIALLIFGWCFVHLINAALPFFKNRKVKKKTASQRVSGYTVSNPGYQRTFYPTAQTSKLI
jgi:hypothetical protein